MKEYRELLIGCGHRRQKIVRTPAGPDWLSLTTLDFNPDVKPDIVHDLRVRPLPFEPNSFDEIHAYEVLEHFGSQGDFLELFADFSEYWRLLKPNGFFCGTVPAEGTKSQWGDPGHCRTINEMTLAFLSQKAYAEVGKSPMTDYRWIYKVDFEPVFVQVQQESLCFVLRAIKPA